MKIAIIDTINHDIGLKILFPNADYYSIIDQYDRTGQYSKYNFQTSNKIEEVTDTKYDVLFIISPLYNLFKTYNNQINDTYNEEFNQAFQKVIQIIKNNNFKTICIFDNHDFDYDPNLIILDNEILNKNVLSKNVLFFKRNYSKLIEYKNNVHAFPYIMFGHKCLIDMVTDLSPIGTDIIDRLFFIGSVYRHEDPVYGLVRDRISIYSKIFAMRTTVSTCNFLHIGSGMFYDYTNDLRTSKYCMDLLGCGDPNVRSFEIFSAQSLRISQRSNLKWGFDDDFCEETYFDNEFDFVDKINNLQQNPLLYKKCLDKQNTIVKNYMNVGYLKNYIVDIINDNDDNNVLNNIILITSVLNISTNPLSYINTRSVYSREQRFTQTIKTINTIKERLPAAIIFLVECSHLTTNETEYLKGITDIFINLYDYENRDEIVNKINSRSKSLGEGTITMYAFKYLLDNNIRFDNFIKISGRYWLNDNFNKDLFGNNINNIVCPIENNRGNLCTSLYKLDYDTSMLWFNYLMKSNDKFMNCEGYEVIFGGFINSIVAELPIIYLDTIGVSGNISVCGSRHDW